MTPADVYQLPVARTGNLDEMLNSRDIWPGFPYDLNPWSVPAIKSLEVRVHAELRRDTRRFWRLFSVWHYGSPVAIGRIAGREGDDSCNVWITDEEAYRGLVAAVHYACHRREEIEVTRLSEDIGDVLEWYGERVKPGVDVYLPWSL